MDKLDLKKELKYLYFPSSKKVEQLAVPKFQFLMIDGIIEPGKGPGTSPMFQENMQALYGAAFSLKFMQKMRQENLVDYPVMALEGLWWVEDGHWKKLRHDTDAFACNFIKQRLSRDVTF